MTICQIAGCDLPAHLNKRFCHGHYYSLPEVMRDHPAVRAGWEPALDDCATYLAIAEAHVWELGDLPRTLRGMDRAARRAKRMADSWPDDLRPEAAPANLVVGGQRPHR